MTPKTRYMLLALLVLMLAPSIGANAQQDRQRYTNIAKKLLQALNQGQSQQIYHMTSEDFQQKMSVQQFATGMNRFKAKNGRWKTVTFQGAVKTGADFTAVFELSEQVLSLSLDSSGKIQRMNFQEIPFVSTTKNLRQKSNNTLSTIMDKLVDSLARPYIQQGHTAGITLAIIKNGKVNTYSYGTTDKKTSDLPDPEHTIFEIGSVTKTFTSLLLAKHLTNGKMQLEDPINQYLPDSIPPLAYQGAPIRLVHLANHTSGFPRLPENIFNGNIDPRNPYLHYTIASLFSYLRHYQVKETPGTKFSYSNFGAGLLGTILEKQTGYSFEYLVKNEIALPLTMNSTFITIPKERKKDLAIGYNERGLATLPWDLASLKGSGAISSTLMDMVKYTQAQLSGKPALADAIAYSHLPTFHSGKQDMALGWRIQQVGNEQYLHHAGGTGGFRSFVGFSKEKQLGLVILSNTAQDVAPMGESLITSLMQK